jgi:hypothetical protein
VKQLTPTNIFILLIAILASSGDLYATDPAAHIRDPIDMSWTRLSFNFKEDTPSPSPNTSPNNSKKEAKLSKEKRIAHEKDYENDDIIKQPIVIYSDNQALGIDYERYSFASDHRARLNDSHYADHTLYVLSFNNLQRKFADEILRVEQIYAIYKEKGELIQKREIKMKKINTFLETTGFKESVYTKGLRKTQKTLTKEAKRIRKTLDNPSEQESSVDNQKSLNKLHQRLEDIENIYLPKTNKQLKLFKKNLVQLALENEADNIQRTNFEKQSSLSFEERVKTLQENELKFFKLKNQTVYKLPLKEECFLTAEQAKNTLKVFGFASELVDKIEPQIFVNYCIRYLVFPHCTIKSPSDGLMSYKSQVEEIISFYNIRIREDIALMPLLANLTHKAKEFNLKLSLNEEETLQTLLGKSRWDHTQSEDVNCSAHIILSNIIKQRSKTNNLFTLLDSYLKNIPTSPVILLGKLCSAMQKEKHLFYWNPPDQPSLFMSITEKLQLEDPLDIQEEFEESLFNFLGHAFNQIIMEGILDKINCVLNPLELEKEK